MCFKNVVLKYYYDIYRKNAFVFHVSTFSYSIYALENVACYQAKFRQIEGYCWPQCETVSYPEKACDRKKATAFFPRNKGQNDPYKGYSGHNSALYIKRVRHFMEFCTL